MEKTTGKPFNVKDSWQFTGNKIKIKYFGEFPGCFNLSFSLTNPPPPPQKNIAFKNGVWTILSHNGAVKCHDSL